MGAARTRTNRGLATRVDLVMAAAALFGEQGYHRTNLDEVARAAGLTKGALYHHFRDKEALFAAVAETVKRDLVARTCEVGFDLSAPAPAGESLNVVVRGCLALLDAHLDPAVQQVLIRDAPAVLSSADRVALIARYDVAFIRAGLRRAIRLGAIADQPLNPLAHLIAGAVGAACAYVAHAPDPAAELAAARAGLAGLLLGLAHADPAAVGELAGAQVRAPAMSDLPTPVRSPSGSTPPPPPVGA